MSPSLTYEFPRRQNKKVAMAGWVTVAMTHLVMTGSLVMMIVTLPHLSHASPLSLPTFHHTHHARLFSSTRRLQITANVCYGPGNEPGVCMFNFECYQKGGHVVGTCIDRFLFGACCDLPDGIVIKDEDEEGDNEGGEGGSGVEGEGESGVGVIGGIISPVPSSTLDEIATAIQNVPLEVETGLLVPLDVMPEGSSSNSTSVEKVLTAIQNVPLEVETGLLVPLDATPEGSSSNSTSVEEVSVAGGATDEVPGTIDVESELGTRFGESIMPGIISIDNSLRDGISDDEELTVAPHEFTETKLDEDIIKESVSTVTVKDIGEITTSDGLEITTKATVVLNQIGSSVTLSVTDNPSITVEAENNSSTESVSKLHSHIDTGIPEALAEGGVVTFTMVESATDSSGNLEEDTDENTEKVLMMTLPDGHDGFSTLQITNFDVTDAFLTEEESTDKPVTTPQIISETDDLYFVPKPTSHRPYIRPGTEKKPAKQKYTKTTPLPVVFWNENLFYTTSNDIEDFTTSYPYKSTYTPKPMIFQTYTEANTELPAVTTTEAIEESIQTTSESETADTTATEPMLIWTLSPQPSILDAKPPESVLATASSSKPSHQTPSTEKEDPLLFWTMSPRPPIMSIRPQTIPTSQPVTQRISTASPDLTDPLAFWTTTRPSRPRPTKTTSGDDILMIWTTRKPPTSQTIPTSNITPLTTEDILGSDAHLKPIIPGDILQNIDGNSHIPQQNTTSEPWATSTYSIHTVAYDDPVENTIPTDNDLTTNSVTMAPTTTTGTPKPVTRKPKPPTTKGTTTSTTTPAPTTEQPISPIDQFIVDFINSSPPEIDYPSTTTEPSPTIDFDLLAQLFNLTNLVPGEEVLFPLPPQLTSTTTKRPKPKPTKRPKPKPVTNQIRVPAVTSSPATTTTTTTTTTTSTTTTTTTTPTTTTTTTTTPTTTTKAWDFRKTCGVRPLVREGRIVNGEKSDFAEWPWQALIKESTWLGIFTKNKCGGVLLNRKYVLTAAHCQPGFLASLIVVLGEWDISDDYEPKKTVQRNVKRVIVHRGYVAKTFDNDLALLEMERAVSFDEHIVPICMPYGHENYIGKTGFVTGWGRLSYGGPVPHQLNEVQVPIIRNSQCQKWFLEAGHVKNIKPEFFCAGYKEGKRDSCEGDSGGPLSVQGEDGRWFLAGTVSHGIKCAYPNLPGVYMKMTYYKPWIESIIN